MKKITINIKSCGKYFCVGIVILLFGITGLLWFKSSTKPSELAINNLQLYADAYEELKVQSFYKGIEAKKQILLYDGSKLTVYDAKIYEPSQISRNKNDRAKYIAIALDIELDIDKNKIYFSSPTDKSIEVRSDKETINQFFAENIVDISGTARNPHSMKWIMQSLKYDMLLSIDDIRLDPYYVRLAFEKESYQPNIFTLWNDYEKKSNDTTYVDAPRKLRGWITWILRVNGAFENDRVDGSFSEGILLKYKNSSTQLPFLIEQLDKSNSNSRTETKESYPKDKSDINDYLKIYSDPYVLFLRKALNAYLDNTISKVNVAEEAINKDKENGFITGLDSFDKTYFRSKFVVFTINNNIAGGKDVEIIFQEKPDRIFYAWVYQLADGNYELRGLSSEENVDKEKMSKILEGYKDLILDKENSL